MGACDGDIMVHCPGGDIGIRIDQEFHVNMTGPATRVGTYEMDDQVISQDVPIR